ncbi:hypothetical protein ACZ90_40405 [Streptomyces albus subsp. albus]|nr:hypothetical protein ACZ90_40405 [Streptomyces albus subsp. albus]
MRERRAERERRRAREFEAFVAGAGGRLLHVAALLTAEPPDACPAAERLLTRSLAATYAGWDRLCGEDPYDRARQDLAARFARTAWRYREPRWAPGLEAVRAWGRRLTRPIGRQRLRPATRRPALSPERLTARPADSRTAWSGGGRLDRLTPQERLVLVLRLHEGIAEEQAAALLGLPEDRVRAVCTRAVTVLLHAARHPTGPGVRPRPPRPGAPAASPAATP